MSTGNLPAVSDARRNANRRNALKSTGPVTEAGKARVRLNAWKHGFRAESDLVAADEADALAARRAAWADAFPADPDDGYRRWLADQIALASVRIDRCQEHQRHQARFEADRSASSWDVDRAAEAAKLGARLEADPDRVVSSLHRSVAGIDWLLCRWRGLADRLDAPDGWDDAHRRLCLALMRTPDEFRASELRLLAELPRDELRELVREHIDDLESSRESAAAIDRADRALAEVGLPTSEGSELRRLRRYEAALWRRFRSLEASFKAGHARTAADPSALDPTDHDIDLDDRSGPPIADLTAFARLLESLAPPNPEPDAPPAPDHPPGPPGPRPSRAIAPPVPDAPIPVAAPSPRPSNPIRLPSGPSSTPVLQNRRARRAARKRKR